MGEYNGIEKETNYKLIDLLKFICAFLVVGIHTRPLQAVNGVLDKIYNYDIANYAVPFFYACTGYFLIVKAKGDISTRLRQNIRKILRLYLLWSVIYLPLTIYGWFYEGNFSLIYVIQCIRNYLFVGENFYSWHLWYLNGLVFALLLIWFLSRRNITCKQMLKIGVVFYITGILLNVLHDLQNYFPFLITLPIKGYFKLFVTTRNGLFESFIFVVMGICIAKVRNSLKISNIKKILPVSITLYIVKVLFSLIGGGQYVSQLIDLFIFFYLFEVVIILSQRINLNGNFYSKIRNISSTVYFVHMYFVAFCALVIFKEDFHNFYSFIICAIGAFIVSVLIEFNREKIKFRKQ